MGVDLTAPVKYGLEETQMGLNKFGTRLGMLVLVGSLGALLGVACGASGNTADDDHLNVLTTIYPVHYLASEVAGDLAAVAPVAENVTDWHDFEPTANQILDWNGADVIFYLSESLEGWVPRFSDSLDDANFVEIAEHADEDGDAHDDDGDEHGDEHDDGDEKEGDAHDHAHDGEDPHVWLNPTEAIELVEHITETLVELDSANQAGYEANSANLITRLTTLHRDFETALNPNACALDEVIINLNVLDHLAEAYQFGTHTLTFDFEHDSSVAPNELAEAISLVRDEGFSHILVVAGSPAEQIQPIVDETDATVAQFYLQEVQIGGLDYFEAMRSNLNVLSSALQCG